MPKKRVWIAAWCSWILLLPACTKVDEPGLDDDGAVTEATDSILDAHWYEQSFRSLPNISGYGTSSDGLLDFVDDLSHSSDTYGMTSSSRKAAVRALVERLAEMSKGPLVADYDWCGVQNSADNNADDDLAEQAGYEVRRFWDHVEARWYVVLLDRTSSGQATIVINPNFMRDIVIEVPHARSLAANSESKAKRQGAYLFRQLNAFALVINGADRCSDAEETCCNWGGSPSSVCINDNLQSPYAAKGYSVADVAHHHRNTLHQTHVVLDDFQLLGARYPWFVQLHGQDSDDDAKPDVIVGDGTLDSTGTGLDTRLSYRFAKKWSSMQNTWQAKSCQAASSNASHYWKGQTLCGNINVQARYTHGADDVSNYSNVCDDQGDVLSPADNVCTGGSVRGSSENRFLHLEQKAEVIEDVDPTGADPTVLAATLRDLYRESGRPCRANEANASYCKPARLKGPVTYPNCTCDPDGASVHCAEGDYSVSSAN